MPDTCQKDDPLADGSAVAWHYDSFPFVCVVMLSDCSEMIGGETAIKTPSGEIMKVRGPTMVTELLSDLVTIQKLIAGLGHGRRDAREVHPAPGPQGLRWP